MMTEKKTIQLIYKPDGTGEKVTVTLTGFRNGFSFADGMARIWADEQTFAVPKSWVCSMKENLKESLKE